jgi:hypothetical protein
LAVSLAHNAAASEYVSTGSSSATRNCMSGSGGRRTAGRWSTRADRSSRSARPCGV